MNKCLIFHIYHYLILTFIIKYLSTLKNINEAIYLMKNFIIYNEK